MNLTLSPDNKSRPTRTHKAPSVNEQNRFGELSQAEIRPQGHHILVDELGGVAFRPKISVNSTFFIQ